jgi:hypothetical protein
MQRLRGRVYVTDGAVPSHSLTPDGRHVSVLDERSWHLLTLNGAGDVVGCARMLVHDPEVTFDELFVGESALAQSKPWGSAVRHCVADELALARRSGVAFFEAGGWAIREDLRHTTHAARLAVGVFAFGQMIGGAIVITTATLRNRSASMLRRIGGRDLVHHGAELPVYYDAQYGCEMAILRFDSESYTPKYSNSIGQLRLELQTVPVVAGGHIQAPAPDTGIPSLNPAGPQTGPIWTGAAAGRRPVWQHADYHL